MYVRLILNYLADPVRTPRTTALQSDDRPKGAETCLFDLNLEWQLSGSRHSFSAWQLPQPNRDI